MADGVAMISTQGVVALQLQIEQDVTVKVSFAVVDLQEDGLLGMDFLTTYQCSIDLTDMVLNIQEKMIPFRNRLQQKLVSRLRLQQDLVIPARSEMLAQASLQSITGSRLPNNAPPLLGIIEPVLHEASHKQLHN